ncbi:hypothetical protein [Bacillus sp. 1P06AnD]|uniref:hypothetical protein n=1 Tax=Bacillus sp. 1P06AnD TaxID=3132208 RepID=UPI0039A26382
MSYISIGSFTVQASIIAFFLALFSGSILYRLSEKRSIGDWYWNSFFLFIIIMKATYIAFNFSIFLDAPLGILYFTGGTKGEIIAFFGIGLYIAFQSKKHKHLTHEMLIAYLYYFISYETFVNALQGNWVATVCNLLLLAGSFWLIKKRTAYSPINSDQLFILILLIEALIVSLFDELLSIHRALILSLGILLLFLKSLSKEELKE